MSVIAIGGLQPELPIRHSSRVRVPALRRRAPAWLAAAVGLLCIASPLCAQTFEPSVNVGAGIQTSYQHVDGGGSSADQFSLGHARIYLSGDVTKNISAMVNTDYSTVTNNIEVLDAVGEFHTSPMFNIWFGRFLPPSDRANLYGPFYSNQWGVYTDGIQDGYTFVFQGRDNGIAYWGDFKASKAQVKLALGAFDGASSDGNKSVLWAGRIQLDLWDPENGYYLNGTYYGDKNLLAIAGATEVQADKSGSGTDAASTIDFLLEKKVLNGGAVTVESEWSDYNRLGGYNGNYRNSSGAYGLVSLLTPKPAGPGKFEVLGKYAIAEFTNGMFLNGVNGPRFRSFRQDTTEVNVNYILKQFDARLMSFYRNSHFNAVSKNSWEAGIGLQVQISKTIR